MYHVVVSDLDGTLLLPDHSLSAFTKETLHLLTAKGIHFVFATGRHHVDVSQIRDSLGINAFMITSNGARVHNTEGELIFSHNLDEDIVSDLATLVYDDPIVTTHFYRNDDWYVCRDCPDEMEFFQESVFNYLLFRPDNIATDGVAKLFFTSETHEPLVELETLIKSRWGTRANICFSLPTCLEVTAAGVSKGKALDEVSRLHGHTLQECIAFGDGMNDVEMLSMAGKGCIMRNAQQKLKNQLPDLEVIGSNSEEAVAHYLRKLFL